MAAIKVRTYRFVFDECRFDANWRHEDCNAVKCSKFDSQTHLIPFDQARWASMNVELCICECHQEVYI